MGNRGGHNGADSGRKRKKRKKKTFVDHLLTVILVLAVGVFIFAGWNLFHIYTEYKAGTDEYDGLARMAVTETKQEDPIDPEEAEPLDMVTDEKSGEAQGPSLRAPMEIDFASLQGINTDVIGWIYMEALPDINYPVVQGTDNEMYLHTTYEGNYNFAGTIFVDYENSRDFSDCNTIIYGHNMKNGSMFGQLKKFVKEEDLYQKSHYFWIFTPEKNYRYEIVSVYTTQVNSPTYTLFTGPGLEFTQYLQTIEANSEIQTEHGELTDMDKIVTLSTCTGNEATRFVVQGRLTDVVEVRSSAQ